MISIKEALSLYAVSDRSWLKGDCLANQVEKAIQGGVSMLQLREKTLSDKEFYQEAIDIQKLCKNYDIPFIINDNVDLAITIQADGIHVGQNDMSTFQTRTLIGPNMILGVSCQSVEQALQAQKDGADYLGVGAIFGTTTKLDANNVSIETLTQICNAVSIPVVAIGGIDNDNIKQLQGTGIAGVAIVSAIFGANNISEATRQLHNQVVEILHND